MGKAVLFDLDGTLIDTLPDIRLSLNETLSGFGYPLLSAEETRAFIGDGAKKLVERALPAGAPDFGAVYADFRARYAASANALTHPFAGIETLLRTLKEMGIGRAVVTNKPAEAAQRTVEQFFGGLIDFVGGDSGEFPIKPDAALSLHAAKKMGAKTEDCLFVGDGEADVLTARNAGMGGVFVLWGYRSKAQLEAVGAERFVSSPRELLAFCNRLWQGK